MPASCSLVLLITLNQNSPLYLLCTNATTLPRQDCKDSNLTEQGVGRKHELASPVKTLIKNLFFHGHNFSFIVYVVYVLLVFVLFLCSFVHLFVLGL